MKKAACPLFVLFAVVACKTTEIEAPLPSVHVLRPSAGRKNWAATLGVGLAQGPEVQGMTGAVRNPAGEEINAVPDYRNDSGGVFSHGDYTTMPVFDIGTNFLQRFELGWTSARGVYAFVDVLDFDRFTLSVSPALYESSQTSRDRGSSLEDGEKTFSSRVRDQSVTGIASVFFGNRASVGFSMYGGYGQHKIMVKVKDYRSGEESSHEDLGTTLLFGLGLDTRIGGLFLEQAWTKLPQRTGVEPQARSFAFGTNFYIGS